MSSQSSTTPLLGEKLRDASKSDIQLSSEPPSRGWMRLGVVIVLSIVSGIILIFGDLYHSNHYFHHQRPESKPKHRESSGYPEGWTEWSSIEPSQKLIWQPCFAIYGSNFQCARLTVPMDYHRPLNASADNPKVHIALVMKPGISRTKDPLSYSESPLLINPGGPGGSGVFLTLSTGDLLQTIVGNDHDIIGFDPRGVGATTPKADCFTAPDDPFGLEGRNIAYMNRMGWALSEHEIGMINSSDVALSKLNARSKALAKLCKRVDETEGDRSIFRYSNTPNVARDMLSIVQAWDEWRSAPSAKPAKSKHEPETVEEGLRTGAKLESTDSTRGKLVYWGFSYGSFLGATFASMFPDKVGRVILDGIVDADHFVNPVWSDALRDTDAIWDKFSTYCAEAGPRCQLYQPGDKAEDVKSRVNDAMELLEKEPAIVLPLNANVPILITASDLRKSIFMSLYAPIGSFPSLAVLLKALIDGQLDSLIAVPSPTLPCHKLTLPYWPDDSMKVIACSDKRYKLNDNLTSLQEHFEAMASYSSFADFWMGAGINLGCNGWEIEAKDPPMRWDDHPAHAPKPINTSFPLLFLSNHLDPVTPLHSAHKMTRKFSRASIVEQKAEGHCTVSCVSLCTIAHIRAYLDAGVLPPVPRYGSDDEGEWATCDCDEKPWKSLNNLASSQNSRKDFFGAGMDEDMLSGKTVEEIGVMMAYRGLREYFAEFMASMQDSEYHNPLQASRLRSPIYASRGQDTCSK